MIEHFTDEIDLVQHEDGSWRADRYPKEGPMSKTSRFDSYPSRPAVSCLGELLAQLAEIFALRNDPDFWEDA